MISKYKVTEIIRITNNFCKYYDFMTKKFIK